MKYQTYPAYKDSGVEWLGEVPEHWDVIQIKHLSAVQRGASPRPIDDPKYFDDEGEYAWVRIADVSSSDGVLRETTQRLSVLGNSLSVKIHSGELFISIAGTVGKPCISAIKACIHDGFVYFPTLKILPIFLYRIFEAGLCYGGLGKLGTQLNLNTETIGAIRVALPNEKELEHVLKFLDHETAKIDTLIEKQQRLIELLKEKRQAVISHAVTKGLNPNAPMKDSGVEWLGEVPEHWEVKKISYLAILKSGDGITSEQIEDTGTYPVYGGNGLRGYSENFNHDGDYILIGRQGALCGNINYGYGKFWASEHAVVVHPLTSLNFKWLGETLRAMNLNQYNVSAAQPGLAVANIICLKIPFPIIEEQNSIQSFIENETAKIDTLIEKSNSAIELIQERRTALISAAVTGKIDVRLWKVPPRANWLDGYDETKDVDVLASLPVDEASEEWE